MTTVHEQFGSGGAYANVKDVCIFGIECEIEAVQNGGGHMSGFKCVQDGSLRNNGWEYITAVPSERADVLFDFRTLHTQLKLKKDLDPFSERTSTHVHMNVSSLDQEHVRQLVLLYALFEEFFFAMVKPNRRDNIHCVPLTETHLPSKYAANLAGLHSNWSKYTAINLLRMADLGTLEFRHLHGTNDEKELGVWLHVLENLWKVSQRIQINAETLSDHKQIEEWFELIFFPSHKVMSLKGSLFPIIRNTLIDVKFSI